ncbi:hypothetical protein AVW11_04025 [Streptomyces amritsarensis]|uniref:Uncharacterized protein n=1 Tax=Streptomyces amritsarensis TaxID=681158 RepID=A0ABX3GCQ1_9ACTN|nr:hypothetical protein [Streptomyces amritsarensis]OLZ72568.1 hypothetical protein AVW11_04025 [Streptomyces amritsarensis]
MTIKRSKASFAVSVNGVPRVVPAGQLVDASDPVIKGRETLFEDAEAYVYDRTPQVERATAEPGERRSLTGRKTAARKAATSKPAPTEKPQESAETQAEGEPQGAAETEEAQS